jgi:hypothetical protein
MTSDREAYLINKSYELCQLRDSHCEGSDGYRDAQAKISAIKSELKRIRQKQVDEKQGGLF